MKQSERNLMVLQNFILHITHCSDEKEESFREKMEFTPEELYQLADSYIEEDHVDGEGNPDDEESSQELIDEVIAEIKKDIAMGDETAIDELLKFLPISVLRGYLPE